MTDRRAIVLVAATVPITLILTALLVVEVVQHRAAMTKHAAILQELREARQSRYEYKVVAIPSQGHERKGSAALAVASIDPSEAELTSLGSAGWELAGSYLEIETAYPNFGDDKYVTGLQPNIRPQRLVLVFRRRVG